MSIGFKEESNYITKMYYNVLGIALAGFGYAIKEVLPSSVHPSGRSDGKYPVWLFGAVIFVPFPFAFIIPLFKRF